MVRPSCKGGQVPSKTNTAHLPAAVLPERIEGRRRGLLWLWKKEEGGDAPSENGCCAVTEETCQLLVPGRDPSAARAGRQVGKATGSDEIKAGLGSSLMPISWHVLNTSRLDAPGSREGAAQAGGLGPKAGAGSLRGPRASPGTLSILLSPSWERWGWHPALAAQKHLILHRSGTNWDSDG